MSTLKHVNEPHGLFWKPYCNSCVAELQHKDGQAICVMCNRRWPLHEIGVIVEEREPAERPSPEAVQAAISSMNLGIDDPPVQNPSAPAGETPTAINWIETDVQSSGAQAIYETWLDGFNAETNSDRNLTIQAVTMFLADILSDEIIMRESEGITGQYGLWRSIMHGHFQARYTAKKGS